VAIAFPWIGVRKNGCIMALDFLKRHGARRLTVYAPPPPDDEPTPESDEHIDLDLEMPEQDWKAIDIGTTQTLPDETPRRFVDGSFYSENIAWLQDGDGHPIPVRLAEVGGVCMAAADRTLKREFADVRRVVASIFDSFPWEQVEEFGDGLHGEGIQLLCLQPQREPSENADEPGRRELSYDFRRNSEAVRMGVMREMSFLEGLALCHAPQTPTIVDGRIGRFESAGVGQWDVIGVIKRQAGEYLHPKGYVALLSLQPGQRTPAFRIPSKHLDVVTWYLKLAGGAGDMPDWGYVRVEVSVEAFGRHREDFGYLNRLSRHLCEIRCRQDSYARGPVSLEPIVRAEESIKSLFQPLNPLKQHFWRLAGI